MQNARDPELAVRTRHALRVRGTVQGVGFRPMVYRVARSARLGGFVCNDGQGVLIEIEGDRATVTGFPDALRRAAPPLARIESIDVEEVTSRGDRDFLVASSTTGALPTRA